MKRYSEGGGGYGGPGGQHQQPQAQQGGVNFKRFRGGPNDVELRLLIPSRVAGSVIGKGGTNIARLRSDFKASVTVPDCPGPERILTIFAELENGLKVIEEVLPALDEARQKYSKGRGGEDGGESGGLGRDEYDVRLIVHQSQAGCIIGKAGSKIKELRDKTGARIKIYTNCCPQSTDRVTQIFGTSDTCVSCVGEIMELLKTAPVKGLDNPYDPHNFDDYYAEEYGGYGGGGGGGDAGGYGTSGAAPGGGGRGFTAQGGRGGYRGGRTHSAGAFGGEGSFGASQGSGGYYEGAGGYGGDLGSGSRNSTQEIWAQVLAILRRSRFLKIWRAPSLVKQDSGFARFVMTRVLASPLTNLCLDLVIESSQSLVLPVRYKWLNIYFNRVSASTGEPKQDKSSSTMTTEKKYLFIN